MREKTVSKKENKTLVSFKGIDISIIFIAIFLSIFCLVFVYSALAFEEGASKTVLKVLTLKFSDRALIKTLGYILIGLLFMFLFSIVDFKNFRDTAVGKILFNPVPYYVLSCGMFVFIEIMKHVGNDVGGDVHLHSALMGIADPLGHIFRGKVLRLGREAVHLSADIDGICSVEHCRFQYLQACSRDQQFRFSHNRSAPVPVLCLNTGYVPPRLSG